MPPRTCAACRGYDPITQLPGDFNFILFDFVAELDSVLNASEQAPAFSALLKVRLKGLERGGKNDAIEVAFKQPVKLVAIEHDTGGCGSQNTVFKRNGRGHWLCCEPAQSVHCAAYVVINLAALTTPKPVRAALGAKARIKRSLEIIGNQILKFATIHYISLKP
jgi:hypothetical protein